MRKKAQIKLLIDIISKIPTYTCTLYNYNELTEFALVSIRRCMYVGYSIAHAQRIP